MGKASRRKAAPARVPSRIAALPLRPAPIVAEQPTARAKWQLWALAALLLVATALAFLPAFHAGFVRWDDQDYVEENVLLSDPHGLAKIWDPFVRNTPQYYPLVFTSYWLEYRLWGLDPHGYHATNVVLHLINVLLVLQLVRRLGARPWIAVAVAAAFALHPTQVASVAWVSERKNTLSGLFYLTAFLLYLRHRRTSTWTAYAGCLLAFAAALLSKSQVITLPVSLLIADWALQHTGRIRRAPVASVLARVTPLLVLGALQAGVTLVFEQRPWTREFSPVEHLLIGANAAWFYVRAFFAPIRLSPIYPEWNVVPADPRWWVAVIAWVVVIAAAIRWRTHLERLTIWGIAQFFLALAPVLGFMSFNFQTYSFVADHFLYLAVIGGALAVALAVEKLAGGWSARPSRSVVVAGIGLVLVAGCGWRTYREATHWRSNETFWMRVLQRDPDGFLGNYNLGNNYRRIGEWSRALPFLERAASIRPRAGYAFRSYAETLRKARDPLAVIEACNAKLAENPSFSAAYLERGDNYERVGRLPDAASDYRQVLRITRQGSSPWNEAYGRMLRLQQRLESGE
jgi:protein O-mannosyl-transferase